MEDRKPNRLQGYNYSTPGIYFITINILNGQLGIISNDTVQLNEYGKIVLHCWRLLFKKYRFIELDEFIIMPDHFHAIINIISEVKTTLPIIIGTFKTTSAKMIHYHGYKNFQWQRSYYDRIIRNDKELFNARNYIKHNALKKRKNNV